MVHGIVDSIDMSIGWEFWEIVNDRSTAFCESTWGHEGVWTERQLNNNNNLGFIVIEREQILAQA